MDLGSQSQGVLPAQRRHCWVMALTAPLVVGPVWMLLPGGTGAASLVGTFTGMTVALLTVTCTYTDLRFRKVPNWATYSAFLWALIINGTASALGEAPAASAAPAAGGTLWTWFLFQGTVGLASCLLGAVLCFGVMIFIYEVAGGGAGDVKLATALGALLGVERGLQAFVYSYIVAGVILLSWSIWTVGPIFLVKSLARKLGSLFLPRWVAKPSEEQERFLKSPIPLSMFFALGCVPVLMGWDLSW